VRDGKVDEGIAKLKKAAELDPKRIRTLLTIGNMYLLKRDRKGAQEWYDKALAADPNAVDVHVTRGNFFFASGDRRRGRRSTGRRSSCRRRRRASGSRWRSITCTRGGRRTARRS